MQLIKCANEIGGRCRDPQARLTTVPLDGKRGASGRGKFSFWPASCPTVHDWTQTTALPDLSKRFSQKRRDIKGARAHLKYVSNVISVCTLCWRPEKCSMACSRSVRHLQAAVLRVNKHDIEVAFYSLWFVFATLVQPARWFFPLWRQPCVDLETTDAASATLAGMRTANFAKSDS